MPCERPGCSVRPFVCLTGRYGTAKTKAVGPNEVRMNEFKMNKMNSMRRKITEMQKKDFFFRFQGFPVTC